MAKKMQNPSLHKDAPQNARKTAARLFGQLKNQRVRLLIVGICILLYTVLNIFTPYYSAIVIDALLSMIRDCTASGTPFPLSGIRSAPK